MFDSFAQAVVGFVSESFEMESADLVYGSFVWESAGVGFKKFASHSAGVVSESFDLGFLVYFDPEIWACHWGNGCNALALSFSPELSFFLVV